jgi:xanthine/uracil permease
MVKTRVSKYLTYLGLSLIFPFITIAFSVALTGSREKGIAVGLIIASFVLLLQNVFFSFYLFKTSRIFHIISGAIVTIISLFLAYLSQYHEMKFKSDFYGLWTSLLVFGISSIFIWEIFYHLIKKKNVC